MTLHRTTLQQTPQPTADWVSVGLLAVAALVFVTAELLPVGILREIGDSFGQSVGLVGLMVTGYGWTVALSAILVTSWLAPMERKRLLLFLLSVFALSNLLVAVAPSLPMLLAARVLGALSHGVFWSTVGSLAVRLAQHGGKARATSLVFGGIAIATVAAVPAGTYLAQHLGWRPTFLTLATMSQTLVVLMALRLPRLVSQSGQRRPSLRALRGHSALLRTFPATALALTGHFCAFTYIGPILENIAAVPHVALPFYLLVFGVAGIAGNALASRVSDQRLHQCICVTLAAMAAAVIGTLLLKPGADILALALVLVWGAGICLLTVSLQSRVLSLAPTTAVDTASSIHVAMFNTGIGSGAMLGGLLIDRLPASAAAVLGGLALLLSLGVIAWPASQAQRRPPAPAAL